MLQIRPLVEYSEEMKKVLDTLEDLYFETDLRGNFVFLNKASLQITGYSVEELLGKSYEVLTDKETASRVFQRFNWVFKTGEHIRSLEHDLIKKDSTRVTISSSVALVKDPQGHRIGFRGIIRDVTQEKELRERLRESEAWYRTVFESYAAAIFVIDADDIISMTNLQARFLSGYEKEEIEGRLKWTDLVHQDDIPMLAESRKKRLETLDETIKTYRIRLKAKEGYKWVYMSVGFIPALKKTIASLIDITEQVKKEEELRHREMIFRQALEASPLPIILYDTELRPTFLNEAFERLFGWSKEEFLSKGLMVLPHIPEELRSEANEFVQEIYKKGITQRRTKRFTKDGRTLDVLLTGGAFKDQLGNPMGIIVFLMDITEEERINAQLKQLTKLEAIANVTSGISHDFNNILQAIYGFTQVMLLKKTPEDPDYKRLRAIEESCERARDLIQNLLVFARKAEVRLKPINLNREVKQNVSILERLLPKMINIELDLEHELHTISADTTQLQQILLNLSVNARDAMPEGGTLTFRTQNVYLDEDYCKGHLGFEPGEYVLLAVSDTGVGIPKEIRDKIFDPFFTTKEAGKGTGLGLSIVYGIVKAHKGHINVYSEEGKGTTFKIYFPAILTDEMARKEREENFHLPMGKGERVLVVDDEESLQDILSETLSKYNYRVMGAMTGEEALRICSEKGNEIALILLDLNMPGMGGIKCLKELEKTDLKAKVIIISGYAPNGDIKKEVTSRNLPYLLKPFDIPSLMRTIRRLLDEK